jgi:NSS family neurotransmitter:Na+ symporter
VLITGIGCFLIGILPALGYNVLSFVHIFRFDILDFMDFLTNSVLMPIAALLTCIFVGYTLGTDKIADEVTHGGKFKFKRRRLFNVMIRYIAPVLLVVILISSVLEGMGIIKF